MLMSGMALLRKNISTVKIEKTIGMFHKFQLEKIPSCLNMRLNKRSKFLIGQGNSVAFFCQMDNLLIG